MNFSALNPIRLSKTGFARDKMPLSRECGWPKQNPREKWLYLHSIFPAGFLFFGSLILVLLTGCVSQKYQMASKKVPPPVLLGLVTETPPATLTLHTVIVYEGPGSWKKEAYWDEYIVSVINGGHQPLLVESVGLVDVLGIEQTGGDQPWDLEKLSRKNLELYARHGRQVIKGTELTVLAAGAVVAGTYTGLSLGAGAFSGLSAGGAGTTATASAGPVLGGTGVAIAFALPVMFLIHEEATYIARSDIEQEFDRRRIVTPFVVSAGATRPGSFFFPISPGPQRLILRCRYGDAVKVLTLDLDMLAGLHMLKQAVQIKTAPAAEPAPLRSP